MNIYLITGCIGLSIVLLFWQVVYVFKEVPNEDRAWRDKPATGFRFVWPIIKLLDFYVSPYLSDNRKSAAHSRLTQAGLEFSLTPSQFVVSRWVSTAASVAFCALILSAFDSDLYALVVVFAPWGYVYPDLWVSRVIKIRRRQMDKELPFYLDVITLSVESGSNLNGAITQAVQKAPDSPLRQELNRVLRDIRAGKPRADALRELSDRAGNKSLSSTISGMIQAERSGASLGPVLRAQATQLRKTRFATAEKQAMEAPVRLLGPLVMFIFPTTFMVLGFLVLSKMLQQNMISWTPVVWAYSWPG